MKLPDNADENNTITEIQYEYFVILDQGLCSGP